MAVDMMDVSSKESSGETKSQANLFHPLFDNRFLTKHAGNIISDPRVAIVEMVANCWDAGATDVHIIWPVKPDTHFEIIDNGSGMTKDEFGTRWYKFNYNRLYSQGNKTIIPNSEGKPSHKPASHILTCQNTTYRKQSL